MKKIQDKEHAFSLFRAGKHREALHVCRQMCAGGIADARVWCLRAVIEGQMKDIWSAATSATRAVELDPSNPDCQFNLGLALLYCGKPKSAVTYFENVARINERYNYIDQFLGQSYEGCGHIDKAIGYYERALLNNPDNVESLAYVARRYELMQETERCRSIISRAIELSPFHPDANIIMARLDRYDRNLDAAQTRLESALKHASSVNDVINLSNELGHVLDRKGNYPEAFRYFSKKSLLSENANIPRYNANIVHNAIRRNKLAINRDKTSKWNRIVDDDLADPIFLIAFPRSGTTLIERILSTNPDMITSNEEGLIQQVIDSIPDVTDTEFGYPDALNHFSDADLLKLRKIYWTHAVKVFGDDVLKKRLFDKLPFNIIDTGLISRLFPDARIIFVLRDPRDVCLSNLMQIYLQTNAMSAFNTIEGAARLYASAMDLWLHYREVLDINLFEIRYEDLVEEPENRIRDMVKFLGLEWSNAYLEYHDKKHYKSLSTPSGVDVTKPVYRRAVGRWKNYRKEMDEALIILEPYAEKFGYR